MNLLIVESPNKIKKIKSFLPSGYTVEASVGHIRHIPEKGTNVDESTFEPTFEIDKKKSDVVRKIKSLADSAERVYLATDPDREGEAISWHIWDILPAKDKKKCQRITFKEITKKAVLDAIASPREIDQNLVEAQKARQVLDRLIGYKCSPLVNYAVQRGTSAGRVQSAALRIICDRQKEVNAFIPEDYWFIDANLQCKKGSFIARAITKEKDNRYKNHKDVDVDLPKLKIASYVIESIERKEKAVNPYPPFDTASLTVTASSLFGWGATKVMSEAQHLYESGFVSYIRSDSYNIAKEAIDEVRDFISNTYKNSLPDKPKFYSKKSSATSQEAHECIRPSHVAETGSSLESDARKLYELIRARFIACQMSDMIMDTVKYTVKASSEHILVATGQAIKEPGWFQAYPYSKIKDEILPDADEKEILKLIKVEDSKHTTQPPPRYNDGSLVKTMEEMGIGRPSTRAPIIKALQDKGYVDKDAKAFVPTELGMKVCDYLEPRFIDFFMDLKFTAGLEEELDLIADGKKEYFSTVKGVYDILVKKIKEAKASTPKKEQIKAGGTCPVCGKGEVLEKESKWGKFYCCSKYPRCKNILIKNDDGTFSAKVKAKKETTGEACPDCKKGELILRTNHKKGTNFLGCSQYPACKFTKDVEDVQHGNSSD
jgi:DNA topoisomerase I